ncbi:MAG: MOSC and FAD-binding oxidoreductase domain-containing protein [Burkholderiales bacterium]
MNGASAKSSASLQRPVARVLAVNVGLPQDIVWRGQTVHTGIWKSAVQGRRMARRLNIDGDGQGDLLGHGGEQRAVMVYQLESYRYWERFLGRSDFTFGQFGENLTVEGLADDEVCIGDRYRIGGALFEVTQPRVTCYRVGIRMAEPKMAALLVAHHRPGFYFRVLEAGDVGAGDVLEKVGADAQRISVAQVDALLYLPGHDADLLQRALRIPSLSPGWKGSLQALFDQHASGAAGGNRGLTAAAGPAPAWPGFRPLRVTQIERESDAVFSLSLQAADGSALPAARAGQFLVLRLPVEAEKPPLLRSYSLSGAPAGAAYRVSIKHESHGVASAFLRDHVAPGDSVECSAPRGNFALLPGDQPVVLLSAGIGVTPMMAMLHALAAAASTREVWWLHGARDRYSHPFAQESRHLLSTLARSRSCIAYSRPTAGDRLGEDYDAPGRLTVPLLERLGVPLSADFYLCGPPSFMQQLTAALATRGVAAGRLHTESFGSQGWLTPGIAARATRAPHPPAQASQAGPRVTFVRSGLSVSCGAEFANLLELAEACDVPVKWACRTGVCHTCECMLIGGAVTYDPDPLEPPAPGNVLTCCSLPVRDIEIDL